MNRTIVFWGAFIGVSSIWWWSQQQTAEVMPNQVFAFEKQQVTGFMIERERGDTIEIDESSGEWLLKDSGFRASMTMVNRVRHQLHDLPVRAVVTDDVQEPDLYGLGDEATVVTVALRGEDSISFEVGDPNPTGVSFYIRPLSGPLKDHVVTVAKAAVDYFDSPRTAFRAPHFCRFDLDSVTRIDVALDSETPWSLQKRNDVSEERWMASHQEQETFAASKDAVHRILGRMLALKSVEYIGQLDPRWSEVDSKYHTVTLSFSQAPSMELRIGNEDSDGQSLFWRVGDPEAALARNGVLEELQFQSERLRNPMLLEDVELSEVETITLTATGIVTASVTLEAGEWFRDNSAWADGNTFRSHLADLRGFFVSNESVRQEAGRLEIEYGTSRVSLRLGQVQTHGEIQTDQPLETQQYRVAEFTDTAGTRLSLRLEEMWVQEVIRLLQES